MKGQRIPFTNSLQHVFKPFSSKDIQNLLYTQLDLLLDFKTLQSTQQILDKVIPLHNVHEMHHLKEQIFSPFAWE